MTRTDIITKSRLLLDETIEKPGAENPFLWNDLVDTACDWVSRRTDALFQSAPQNLVSGTAQYSYPPFYKINSVLVTNSTGGLMAIPQVRAVDIDRAVPSWRSALSGTPQYIVIQGTSEATGELVLSPPPNYSATNGLAVEGYIVPSKAGTSGANLWPSGPSVCPLPADWHILVVYRAALLRIGEYPTQDNVQRQTALSQDFNAYWQDIITGVRQGNQSRRFDEGESLAPPMQAGAG